EVALTRMPYVVHESLDAAGLAEPAWLITHRIRSFAALPIVSGERCLGVLALFSQRDLEAADVARLEGAAPLAAALVAAARGWARRAGGWAPPPQARRRVPIPRAIPARRKHRACASCARSPRSSARRSSACSRTPEAA